MTTTEEMYRLTLPEMRQVFGGVNGERWWRMIRGQAVTMPPVQRWQIGHTNVLAPEYRTPDGAWSVACRLLEKAAERLRAEGYHARCLRVEVSGYGGESWSRQIKFAPSCRTNHLLSILSSPLARPASRAPRCLRVLAEHHRQRPGDAELV